MEYFEIKVVRPNEEFYINQCLEIARQNHVDNGGYLSHYKAVRNACDYIICAVKNEKVVGYLGVDYDRIRNEYVIVQSAVVDSERGKGIGTKMMNFLKHHSLEAKQIISFVDKDNVASNKIHLKNGFTQVDEEYDYYYELKTENILDNQSMNYTDVIELEGE